MLSLQIAEEAEDALVFAVADGVRGFLGKRRLAFVCAVLLVVLGAMGMAFFLSFPVFLFAVSYARVFQVFVLVCAVALCVLLFLKRFARLWKAQMEKLVAPYAPRDYAVCLVLVAPKIYPGWMRACALGALYCVVLVGAAFLLALCVLFVLQLLFEFVWVSESFDVLLRSSSLVWALFLDYPWQIVGLSLETLAFVALSALRVPPRCPWLLGLCVLNNVQFIGFCVFVLFVFLRAFAF